MLPPGPPPSPSPCRSTTKYWVRNHDLEKLQAEISRHLPLLIFQKQQQQGQQQGTPAGQNLQQNASVSAGGNREDSDTASTAAASVAASAAAVPQPVTSVYFDSLDLSVYCSRLAREDGASLVRVR